MKPINSPFYNRMQENITDPLNLKPWDPMGHTDIDTSRFPKGKGFLNRIMDKIENRGAAKRAKKADVAHQEFKNQLAKKYTKK